MKNIEKCAILGCENTSDKGNFIGNICNSCYETITTGKVNQGTSFIHGMKKRINEFENMIDDIKLIMESYNDWY